MAAAPLSAGVVQLIPSTHFTLAGTPHLDKLLNDIETTIEQLHRSIEVQVSVLHSVTQALFVPMQHMYWHGALFIYYLYSSMAVELMQWCLLQVQFRRDDGSLDYSALPDGQPETSAAAEEKV